MAYTDNANDGKGLVELFKNGADVDDLARRYNLSAAGVRAVLTRMVPEDFDKIDKRHRDQQQRDTKGLLSSYESGMTLEEIGQTLGVTRERVRQLIRREIGRKFGARSLKDLENPDTKSKINIELKRLKGASKDNRQGSFESKFSDATDKGIKPEYFNSASGYALALGVSLGTLKKNQPEVVQEIMRTRRLRWSARYDRCRECGTTRIKHAALGYCEHCYTKSEYFRSMQRESFVRNFDKRRAQNKKYREEQAKRPEVQARTEEEYDNKYFGGNRKRVLERDNYVCAICGLSIKEKDKRGRLRVRVFHLNGNKSDNSMSNLQLLCRRCYNPRYNPNFGPNHR